MADPIFGSPSDIKYARGLWQVLAETSLVGANSKPLEPFFGGAKPHGMILELASQVLIVNKHNGFVVLKRNYEGKDVSVEKVALDRAKYLSSITVMYQREPGYDADNMNWFWVKYSPDGTIVRKNTPTGERQLAGRIAKGSSPEGDGGCLYCHASAGGGDYIFYPDIKLPGHRYR
jgi:hypothetical protein